MKINIKIDQLVLDGFDSRDIHGISAAIEHEMTRLFSESRGGSIYKTDVRGQTINQIDAGSFDVKSHATSNTIGNEVARSVYRKITQ